MKVFEREKRQPDFDVSLQVTIPNEWERMAPANIGYTEPLLVLIFGFIAYLDSITIIQGIGVIMVAVASITIEKRQLEQNQITSE